MKVLFLGPVGSPVWSEIRSGDESVQTEEIVSKEMIQDLRVDFAVSHGYRHVVRPAVLDLLKGRAINLHISLLPWNRGSDPNFWSWFDSTPKGVSIHHMDESIDSGAIIAQAEVAFGTRETLRTSYEKLQERILLIFRETWQDIRRFRADRRRQEGAGSMHRRSDLKQFESVLYDGWDTPVSHVEECGRIFRQRRMQAHALPRPHPQVP